MSKNQSTRRPAALPEIVFAVILGWLVPGLGHWTSGARRRGIVLGILVAGTFLVGLHLSQYEAVSRDLHPFSFYAQVFVGGAAVPLLYLDPAVGKVLPPRESIEKPIGVPRHTDTGVLFTNIAGLLNLLILFDLVDRLLGYRSARGAVA